MTAAISKPALNLREYLARIAGLESRMAPPLVRQDFTNLVTNGGFDSGISPWFQHEGAAGAVTVESGRLKVRDIGGTDGKARVELDLIVGRKYRLQTDLETTGQALWSLGDRGSGTGTFTATLTFGTTGTETFTKPFTANIAAASITLTQAGTGVSGYFDNVSLWEADPDDDAPWLRLAPGYKVGTRGMIVRDGVVLHPSDYTEITRQGQTFIKPLVAPGHDTEFSIWCEVAE